MEKYHSELKQYADGLIENNPHQADAEFSDGTIYKLRSLVANSTNNAENIRNSFNLKAEELIEQAKADGVSDVGTMIDKMKDIGANMINEYTQKFVQRFK